MNYSVGWRHTVTHTCILCVSLSFWLFVILRPQNCKIWPSLVINLLDLNMIHQSQIELSVFPYSSFSSVLTYNSKECLANWTNINICISSTNVFHFIQIICHCYMAEILRIWLKHYSIDQSINPNDPKGNQLLIKGRLHTDI